MTSTTEPPIDVEELTLEEQPVPTTLAPGAVVLVAIPADVNRRDLPLLLLSQYADPQSGAIVVTTGRDETSRLEELSRNRFDRVGVVDTTTGERLTALYRAIPTIHTPQPGDIERTTVAISELRTALSGRGSADVSLAISSLTPIIADVETPPPTVLSSFLDAVRPANGIVTVGVEYTRHDERTMRSLSALADGVIWIERSGDGTLSLEYRSAGRRRNE